MSLVLPGKQKLVTMYFVAVKQRLFKCRSGTVYLLKVLGVTSEGLVLNDISSWRNADP